MKRNTIKLTILIFSLLASSCEKSSYLNDGLDTGGSEVTNEQFWGHREWPRSFLNNAYTHLPDEYDLDGDGAMLASASDEAVNSFTNSPVSWVTNGTWGAGRTFNDVYADMYNGIRKTNLFLENIDRSPIVGVAETTENTTDLGKQMGRLKGQAYFLRAFYHFELLKRYGAVPIVTSSFASVDETNLPRNSYQECVNQIVVDCDSAVKMLPLHQGIWNNSNKGRATGAAALALKSRLLLYAASPLNNQGNDQEKWLKAAEAAKEFITLVGNNHRLHSSYPGIFNFAGTNNYNPEYIFGTRVNNRRDIEENNAPISISAGKGRTNPTQEMVDAFEAVKKAGTTISSSAPITDPSSGYSEQNPYLNRDPRLDMTIFYNNSTYNRTPVTKVETYVGGKDGLNAGLNATRTGYYLKKFLVESVNFNVTTPSTAPRPWVLFRYAEILLNYAEAVNELSGPDALPVSVGAAFPMTARAAINMIRARPGVGMPALAAGLSKDAMRERIKNERRVELCFEGHRFYDLRRWKEGESYLNKPLTGMRITKNPDNSFSYQRFTFENRVFDARNYRFPFSINDINRQPALQQNEGYQ